MYWDTGNTPSYAFIHTFITVTANGKRRNASNVQWQIQKESVKVKSPTPNLK
jgi:hypothetical protein